MSRPIEFQLVVADLLQQTKACPRMYAASKEALLSRVATLLEVAGRLENGARFYENHVVMLGSIYTGLDESYDDEWAARLIDNAMRILLREQDS